MDYPMDEGDVHVAGEFIGLVAHCLVTGQNQNDTCQQVFSLPVLQTRDMLGTADMPVWVVRGVQR